MATFQLPGISSPTQPGAADELPPVGPARRALALFAALMTLPYLVLKVAWLTGSRAGLLDPEFGASAAMLVLNVLTAGLDVVALVLAVVLLTRRGIRAPALLVLPPMWIGAGLLGQILLALPVSLVAQVVSPAQTGSGEVPPIAGWVYAMVYAGFAGLGVGLLGAFAIYAWQRWARRPVYPASPVARRALLLAAALALGSGTMHLLLSDVPLLNRVLDLGISAGTATALVALRRPLPPARTRVAVVLVFVGTGALAAWGTYVAVVTGVPNELVGQTEIDWATVGASVTRLVAGLVGAGALTLRLRPRG